MSIVSRSEQRILLEPRPGRHHVFRDSRLLKRNHRWLATQRQFGFTVRETAAYLNRPTATVGVGIAAALAAEQADLERASLGYDDSPVVDARSGLTENDVAYLIERYPPGTAIGDHPAVVSFLARHDPARRTREVA